MSRSACVSLAPFTLRLLVLASAAALAGCPDSSPMAPSDPPPQQGTEEPTEITRHPASASTTEGHTVTFSVEASGSNLGFQWQRSTNDGATWVDIRGATTPLLSISSPTSGDAGLYRVRISSTTGQTISNLATLTVTEQVIPPTISVTPLAQEAAAGGSVTFTVTAHGTSPNYQWQSRNSDGSWENVADGSSATLLLENLTLIQNGSTFRVIVRNEAGSVTSSEAQLSVIAAPEAPRITLQPTNRTVVAGQPSTFSVAATGVPAPNLQWQRSVDQGASYQNIEGAVAPTLSIAATTTEDSGGLYRVQVTNTKGSAYSESATLTVEAQSALPVITSQPGSVTITEGTTATFRIDATGTPSPTYQWQVSTDKGITFENITGATRSTFTTNPQAAASGMQLRALVSNSAGTVSSNSASLIVYLSQDGEPWKNLITTKVGDTVSLDASRFYASHPTTKNVNWKFDFRPRASQSTIELTDALHAAFVADIPGHFIVSATGTDESQPLWTEIFRIRSSQDGSNSDVPDDGETDPVKLMLKNNCTACHALERKLVGPAYRDISSRYRGNSTALETLTQKTIRGGVGMWGQIPMPANRISVGDANIMITWILSQ